MTAEQWIALAAIAGTVAVAVVSAVASYKLGVRGRRQEMAHQKKQEIYPEICRRLYRLHSAMRSKLVGRGLPAMSTNGDMYREVIVPLLADFRDQLESHSLFVSRDTLAALWAIWHFYNFGYEDLYAKTIEGFLSKSDELVADFDKAAREDLGYDVKGEMPIEPRRGAAKRNT